MGKDPAVLFYTSDFLGGVTLMDMKERGQYITLLCLQRERGHMTEQEMKKAIGGRLSEELRKKFVTDEDGKLYNVRMETEIQKRNAHCEKQRANISKRWNKEKAASGSFDGNTVEHTTVLPLGNGSRSRNGSNSIGEDNSLVNGNGEDRGSGGKGGDPHDPELARVMDYFLDKINPLPSSDCTTDLIYYTKLFGADIVIHAFDIARDALKSRANWPYIRSILRRYKKENVQTLGDVLESEQAFDAEMEGKKAGGKKVKSFADMWREEPDE